MKMAPMERALSALSICFLLVQIGYVLRKLWIFLVWPKIRVPKIACRDRMGGGLQKMRFAVREMLPARFTSQSLDGPYFLNMYRGLVMFASLERGGL